MVAQDVVRVGSRVRVRDEDCEEEFTLVPECDADAFADRISAESPVGRALLGARRHRGSDGGGGQLIAERRSTDDALVSATLHLVGQSRAFVLQLDGARNEIGTLNDDRAAGLVEALGLSLSEPAAPGTLRHVEQAASDLLRSLRAGEASW